MISTEQSSDQKLCAGCGKAFRGDRGLKSHQNHRNAAPECLPHNIIEPDAAPVEPVIEVAAVRAAPVSPVAEAGDRDELIRTAHTYAFVPEFHTLLVKVDGRDKWAIRMLAEDAFAIARTADNRVLVRRTKHENSTETTVTDYYWNDGLRVRMTERNAV
jgi:hypothetical protein